MGEAIAFFVGNRYGETARGGENREFQNNFIPSGLAFDLVDNVDDLVIYPNDSFITINESTEGFTPSMIFDALKTNNSEPTSINDYRIILRDLHLASTPNTLAEFDDVFDIYDVVN